MRWIPTAWLLALLYACGGKAVIDGEAQDGAGGDENDPFAGILCGSAGTCTFECCLDLTQEDAVPFCATNCTVGLAAYACDGPEDCNGGSCCGDITATSCKPTCGSGDLERCHTDADCAPGVCTEATLAGVEASVCMR